MNDVLPLYIGLLGFLLLLFLFRKSGKTKAGSNAVKDVSTSSASRTSPPPLPVRKGMTFSSSPSGQQALDYPKCPIDRCRNEPGKPQVVFWDSTQKCYTCCHGHHFTGRE